VVHGKRDVVDRIVGISADFPKALLCCRDHARRDVDDTLEDLAKERFVTDFEFGKISMISDFYIEKLSSEHHSIAELQKALQNFLFAANFMRIATYDRWISV